MAKYSYEIKKKVVAAYLNGEGGYDYLCKQYGIKADTNLKTWIAAYKQFGDEGLMRSRKNQNYSLQFKLSVVESYLTGEISYRDLAMQYGINNPSLIARWVSDFRTGGLDALRPKKKGRKALNAKNDVKADSSSEKIDTSAEHVKELEDELLRLRIENAFLKAKRRLRLEEEALLKTRRELSTASEDNSN